MLVNCSDVLQLSTTIGTLANLVQWVYCNPQNIRYLFEIAENSTKTSSFIWFKGRGAPSAFYSEVRRLQLATALYSIDNSTSLQFHIRLKITFDVLSVVSIVLLSFSIYKIHVSLRCKNRFSREFDLNFIKIFKLSEMWNVI